MSKTPKNALISFRIDLDQRAKFEAYATQRNTTISALLKNFIEQCLSGCDHPSPSIPQPLASEIDERLEAIEAAILEAKGDASNAVQSVATLAAELEEIAARLGGLVAPPPPVVAVDPGEEAAKPLTREEIREEAKRLLDEGKNWSQVANIFNTRGIPTKSGEGEWHGNTVRRLLEKG